MIPRSAVSPEASGTPHMVSWGPPNPHPGQQLDWFGTADTHDQQADTQTDHATTATVTVPAPQIHALCLSLCAL